MKRVFLIHGWNSKPTDGWKPWLKQKLEEKGFKVVVPAMPTPMKPNVDEWLFKMRETVTKPDEDTYLVGHSLGCVITLKYLEEINGKIGGAVFVAGFLDSMGYPMIGGFFKKPIDIESAKSHCNRFAVVHSEDDKWVNIKYANELAAKLGVKLNIEKNFGHFTSKEAQPVLDAVMKIIND